MNITYKEIHENFISGHNGSSFLEILFLLWMIPVTL